MASPRPFPGSPVIADAWTRIGMARSRWWSFGESNDRQHLLKVVVEDYALAASVAVVEAARYRQS
jgi:hypothetical protein